MNDFDEFYEKTKRRYLRQLEYSCGGWAEDILHNAFERALMYWDRQDKDKNLQGWFHIILRNCVRDHRAAEMGRNESSLDEYDEEVNDMHEHKLELVEEIKSEIKQYPEEEQEVLTKFLFEDFTVADLGRTLPISYYEAYKIINQFKKRMVRVYGDRYAKAGK